LAGGFAAGRVRIAVVEPGQTGALLADTVHARRRREREGADVVAIPAVVDVVQEVEAFVDDAVAVVVEVVTRLDARVRLGALAAVRRILVGVEEVGEAGDRALAGDAGRGGVLDRAGVEALAAVRDVRLPFRRVVVARRDAAAGAAAAAAAAATAAAAPAHVDA